MTAAAAQHIKWYRQPSRSTGVDHAQLHAMISMRAAAHCREAIINLPSIMDALTLRQILKEEMATVKDAFSCELASIKESMVKQTAELTDSYRSELQQVRHEHQAMRQAVDEKMEQFHRMMAQFNIDGSRPSTTTSQQTFTSDISEGPQLLPDAIWTGNVAAWNAQTGAPSWAPGADGDAAEPEAIMAPPPQGHSVPILSGISEDPPRDNKSCILCHGTFKHKRGARQHMMKAFKPNSVCKFIVGYAPHDNILEPFARVVIPQAGPEAVWKLAVKTIMRSKRS
jgi:hypothetical protein